MRVRGSIDQGLQIRAATGNQDAKPQSAHCSVVPKITGERIPFALALLRSLFRLLMASSRKLRYDLRFAVGEPRRYGIGDGLQ